MDMLKLTQELCAAPGVSGLEEAASQKALEYLREFADQAYLDDFQNVIGIVRRPREGEKTILLDAHIDQIGLIVTYIDDNGFLKVANCGGVDRRLVLAQQVTVFGVKPVTGIIATKPPHLTTKEDSGKVPEIDEILIDVGMTKEEAEKVIPLGSRVIIDSSFHSLMGQKIASCALDDRIGVAAVLRALELVKGKKLGCGISVLFSSQEETGERGAMTAGFDLEPDISLSVDVSFAYTPDASPYKCGKMGKGVMIGVAPSLSKPVYEKLIYLAEEGQIPHQLEVMGGATGTNADTIGTLKGGVATGLLSVPLKYMHTPVEVVDLDDVESVAQLIAAYLMSFGEECSYV